MKVLMLGWELPPHNSGGLGVACYQLTKTLAKKGADITFVVPYTATHECAHMRVISAKIASPRTFLGIYDSVDRVVPAGTHEGSSIFELQDIYADRVARIEQLDEYDVIHAHDWLTFRAGLRAKELSGRPLIVHIHSIESDRAGNKSGHPHVHEIEEMGLHLADQIVAVSEFTKRKIVQEYGISAEKIHVAHNSIDAYSMPALDNDNAYRYLSRLKSNGYTIVSNVGRHTVQKGLSNLLFTAQQVLEFEPKTIFLLVGAGDQHHELIELSAKLGISKNVLFVGFQRGKQWRDAFGIADLFVMPSVSEPFGLTPLEAIVYDTPSLISKQSGVSEVLGNCLKADFWDIDKMTDQIVAVIRNQSLSSALINNARGELSKHSWDKAAHIFMDIYKQKTQLAL